MPIHRVRQTRVLKASSLAALAIAALVACRGEQNGGLATDPKPASVSEVPHPLASFASMVGGEWKQTAQSGTSMFDSWHWGPGGHSLRVMTDGLSAAGEPWREVQVFYWHPGRKQVRLLGLSQYQAGVGEGWFVFDGKIGESLYELQQRGGPRALRWRWTFTGPDAYRAELSEAVGTGEYAPMVVFDRVRVVPDSHPRASAAPHILPEKIHIFEPIIGRSWESGAGERALSALPAGNARRIASTVEWVPYCDAVYVRVQEQADEGKGASPHLLDVYLYHHTGTGAVHCLALSAVGGVYEGQVRALEGRSVQADLTGYEGDRVIPMVLRMDVETDGKVRTRLWSINGAERTLMHDITHIPRETGSP